MRGLTCASVSRCTVSYFSFIVGSYQQASFFEIAVTIKNFVMDLPKANCSQFLLNRSDNQGLIDHTSFVTPFQSKT